MSALNKQLIDNIAFAVMIKHPEYLEKFNPEFFDEDTKQRLLKITKSHFETYKETPTNSQLKEIYRLENVSEDLSIINNYIDSLYNYDLSQYTKEWLDKSLQSYISVKQLDSSIKSVLGFLKTTEINMNNVDFIQTTVKDMIAHGTDISFDLDLGSNLYDSAAYKIENIQNIPTGFSYMDTVLGGGFPKPSLNILAAPPKIGKCVTGKTKIKVRNKKTGEVKELTYEDFYKNIKKNGKQK